MLRETFHIGGSDASMRRGYRRILRKREAANGYDSDASGSRIAAVSGARLYGLSSATSSSW